MGNYKIIFTGPVGAGKTTAITAISDTPIVSTDERATDMTAQFKSHTTVAMDYGVMKLREGERVHLYGTPGQERFDFMWDILTEGGLGLVLLVDNSRIEPFRDLHFFLRAFGPFIDRTAVVIGVTHMDEKDKPTLMQYQAEIERAGRRLPVMEVDAHRRDDVVQLVQCLLYCLDPGISD